MIYCDMDGVLARWDTNASIEDTFEPGYFAGREPEPNMIDALKRLKNNGYEVAILSAVYREGTASADKQSWLKNNGLNGIPRVFVPYGERKSDYIGAHKENILIDDYSKNLHDWSHAGYTGVKFYNGINGTHGTWKGYSVNSGMTAEQIYVVVKAIADHLEEESVYGR